MSRKIVAILIVSLLVSFVMYVRFNIVEVKAPNGYPVHNLNNGLNYTRIQEAINANETLNGHTIVVDGGVFYENIVISKSLILMGQGNNLTIIDSCGKGDVIYLKANNTRVKGFTVRNGVNGIEMAPWTSGHVIEDNIVLHNDQGISGHYDCKNITVHNNTITLNNVCGVRMLFSNSTINNNLICNNGNADNWLWSSGIEIVMGVGPADIYCINNTIVGNAVRDNNYGIWAIRYSVNNTFIHNNFINNTKQICGSMNMHNDTFLENYWSDYTSVDLYGGSYQNVTGSDGIGDTAYAIDANNTDSYPLMGMFSDFNVTTELHVQTICNSTISDFQFNDSAISFNVTGEEGTAGFCRICIPTALMNVTYKVFVNGTEVSYNLLPCSDETYSYLYFNYTHSIQKVIIILEFPSFFVLPLFMTATLLAVIVYKRKHSL